MPPASKSPAPPSFYSNLAQMQGGVGGGDDKAKAKPASEDEAQIVKTLFSVFEKWRKAAGSDKGKSDLIQKMVDTLEQYNTQFLKGGGGGEGRPADQAPPAAAESQGPTPAAGGGAGGGGGAESQMVPA